MKLPALILFILFFVILLAYPILSQPTCDYKVEILVDAQEFKTEDFKWRMRAIKIEGKSTNITGTAKIEDSNGKTVKSYKPWTSQAIAKQKTSNEYSPNLKPGNHEITAEISVDCDDTNKDNNVDRKEIKIKGEVEEKSKKSKSEETKIVNQKVQNEESILDTGNKITTKSKPAPKEATENTIELKSQNINQNMQALPITTQAIRSSQNPETVYVSSNEKAKGWIMIFLLTLSILLNIILIWKR